MLITASSASLFAKISGMTKRFGSSVSTANDPADELIEMGAEVLISINASPFNKGKMGQRCSMVSHRAKASQYSYRLRQPGWRQRRNHLRRREHRGRLRGKDHSCRRRHLKNSLALSIWIAVSRDERCLPGDDIETIHQRTRPWHSRLRAKESIHKQLCWVSLAESTQRSLPRSPVKLWVRRMCLSVMMPSPYSSRSSIDDSVELGQRLGMKVIERPITEAFQRSA